MTTHKVSETRTFNSTHNPDDAIVVVTHNGDVTISADPSLSEAQIEANITCSGETKQSAQTRLADTVITIESAENQTMIKPIFAGGKHNGDGASFTIRVPGATGVDVASSNGRITIDRLAGNANLGTSNGRITLTNHDGPAVLDTSNGRIKVTSLAGGLEAYSSNGRIEAVDIGGPAKLQTSNGKVTLTLANDQAGPVEIDTSNGDVQVNVGQAFVGRVRMDTSNGRVTVTDPTGRVTSRSLKKKSGEATIGSGGEESIIETSNGSVELIVGES